MDLSQTFLEIKKPLLKHRITLLPHIISVAKMQLARYKLFINAKPKSIRNNPNNPKLCR